MNIIVIKIFITRINNPAKNDLCKNTSVKYYSQFVNKECFKGYE